MKDNALKKGDIIKMSSYHMPGQWHGVAKEVIETDDYTISINYYLVLKVDETSPHVWSGCYQVTYEPYTKLGVYDCGFGVTMLHKSGERVKPYGTEWKVVGFQRVYSHPSPPCLKGNPGYDLLM